MREFLAQNLIPVLVLIGLAIGLTVYVFRRRMFDRPGVYREGKPVNPDKVRRENRGVATDGRDVTR